MASPLMNTLRSFWTPEKTTDPAWLREVRIDKGIFLLVFGTPVLMIVTGAVALCVSVQ